MKKSFINYFSFVLFLAVLSAGFTGCDKDDDDGGTAVISGNKITVTIDGAGNRVDMVKLYADGRKSSGTIAEAEVKDNRFTMELPETLPSQYLEPLKDEMPDGITLSDASAKGCFSLEFYAYKNNDFVGYLSYVNFSGKEEDYKSGSAFVDLVYVDKDLSITGSYTDEDYKETYNCHLKKGWNYMAEIYRGKSNDVEADEYTTSLPGGLKWILD
jgi:hypothetical protein